VVLAFAALVLLKLLVYLKKDAEAEVIPNDFKPRKLLHKLVHQLQPSRRVQGVRP